MEVDKIDKERKGRYIPNDIRVQLWQYINC